jgi:hypothetical protein
MYIEMIKNGRSFFHHLLIVSILVSVSAVLIESNKEHLGGLALGIPLGFIYLLIATNQSKESRINFSKGAFIGGIYFTLYTLMVFLLCKHTSMPIAGCIFLTTIVIIGASYIYYRIDS